MSGIKGKLDISGLPEMSDNNRVVPDILGYPMIFKTEKGRVGYQK